MSNFQCPQCGMVNIDCEKEGFKTPKELEYEKALKEIEEYCNSVSVEENLYNSRHFYNGGVTVEVVNEILNIINKAKGEGNE